jgi:hydrogenase nickel incorporation protein HypB
MRLIFKDRDFFYESLRVLNPEAVTFEVSCRSGEGLANWTEWLRERLALIWKSPKENQM